VENNEAKIYTYSVNNINYKCHPWFHNENNKSDKLLKTVFIIITKIEHLVSLQINITVFYEDMTRFIYEKCCNLRKGIIGALSILSYL